MRMPGWKRAGFGLIGLAVAVLVVNISSREWNVLLTVFGLILLGALVIVPYLTALLLYLLHLHRQAARYADWASRHYPLPAHRAHCALLAINIYSWLGDTKHSLECAEIGMTLSEKRLDHPPMRTVYAHCLNAKGTAALNRGQYRVALDAFSLPLRMEMDKPLFNALFYSNSAAALYCLGRFPEALTMVEHARGLASGITAADQETRAVTHHNAALTLIELGRSAEGLAETQAALTLKTGPQTQALVQATHAWTLWENGARDSAEEAFLECERILPPKETAVSRMFYRLRGQMRAAQNRYNEARADLEKSCTGDEVSPAAYYHLAHLADKCGQSAEAETWRERLLGEAPESFYAQWVRDEQTGMV